MTTATATELKTFNFQTRSIRVLTIDGQPWFVATDACKVLGLNTERGTFVHLSKLAADEKRGVTPNLVRGSGPSVTLISESGLYKLIMRSDKPEAVAFQEWVTREVLPAIRKTGGYMLAGADRATIHEGQDAAMPDMAGVFAELKAMEARLAASQQDMERRINDQVARVLVEIGERAGAKQQASVDCPAVTRQAQTDDHCQRLSVHGPMSWSRNRLLKSGEPPDPSSRGAQNAEDAGTADTQLGHYGIR